MRVGGIWASGIPLEEFVNLAAPKSLSNSSIWLLVCGTDPASYSGTSTHLKSMQLLLIFFYCNSSIPPSIHPSIHPSFLPSFLPSIHSSIYILRSAGRCQGCHVRSRHRDDGESGPHHLVSQRVSGRRMASVRAWFESRAERKGAFVRQDFRCRGHACGQCGTGGQENKGHKLRSAWIKKRIEARLDMKKCA